MGDDTHLHNLTIMLPSGFNFTGGNGTSISDKSLFTVTNTSNSITWNATSYPDGFSIGSSSDFAFNATGSGSLGQYNFTIIAYSNTSLFYTFTKSVFIANTFSFNGTIKNSTGVAIHNGFANITVTSMGQNSPPTTLGSFTAYSNAVGNFSITNIPTIEDLSDLSNVQLGPGGGDGGLFYSYSCGEYNDSTYNYAMNISSSLPTMGAQMLVAYINNSEVYLRPAVTFVVNATGPNYDWENGGISSWSDRSFELMMKDKKLGFPVQELSSSGSTTKIFAVACGDSYQRNYTMTIRPTEGGFPISLNFSNILNTCRNNDGNFSISGVNTTCQQYNGTYRVNVIVNTSTTDRNFSGYFNDISGTLSTMRIIAYTMEDENMLFESWPLPYNLGNMDQHGFNDEYDLSTKHFNITLPGTEAPSYIMLRAYAQTQSGDHYMGSRIITAQNGQLSLSSGNFTMNPIVEGSDRAISAMNCSNNWTDATVITTKGIQFNLVDTNGQLLSSENPFVEILLDHNSTKDYRLMIDGANGTFTITLNNNTDLKELSVYSKSYAPISSPVSWNILSGNTTTQIFNCTNGICNITMREFGGFDPLGESAELDMGMYKSNESCNRPNPPDYCDLCGGSMDESSFSPLKAILKGDINMMISVGNNVSVYYINTDLLASGPPDAAFTTNGTQGQGGIEEAWKFGSQGPDIYDQVLMKVPCPESIQNKTINISIPVLYDSEFNVIWDRDNGDTISTITSNSTLYNMYESYIGTQYEAYINGTGVIANETDEHLNSSLVYYDRDNQKIWMKIPHFSGSKINISGNPPGAPTDFTATASGTSSIILTWTKGTNSENTRIQRSGSAYPTAVTSGTNVYNGTGTSKTDSVSAGSTYYYSAWAWDTGEKLWSSTYDSATATTSSGGSPSGGTTNTETISYVTPTEDEEDTTTTDEEENTITTTTVTNENKEEIETLFDVIITEDFTVVDNDNDGIIDDFSDPNGVLNKEHIVKINDNNNVLLSVNDDIDSLVLWDTDTGTITKVTHNVGSVEKTEHDKENNQIKITVTVDKTDWLYLEIYDSYPDISDISVETSDGRTISSDMIKRENGKIYVLDDPDTTYNLTYNYVILKPTFNPINGSTVTNSKPTITISYGENVTILESKLNDENIIFTTEDNTNFTYTPTNNLTKGTYILSIKVEDIDGNNRTDTATYIIDIKTQEQPAEELTEENTLLSAIIVVLVVIAIIIVIFAMLFKTGYLYLEEEKPTDKKTSKKKRK